MKIDLQKWINLIFSIYYIGENVGFLYYVLKTIIYKQYIIKEILWHTK